jgi:uncharacterized protein (TIGR03000 family)
LRIEEAIMLMRATNWKMLAVSVMTLATASVGQAQYYAIRGGPIYGGPVYGGGPSYFSGAYAPPYSYYGPQLSGAGFGNWYTNSYPQYNGYAISQPYVVGSPAYVAPSAMMMQFPPQASLTTPPGGNQQTPATTPTGPTEGSRSIPGDARTPPKPVQPAIGRAYFTVNVPADARLWVEGAETKMAGASRRFSTPQDLDPLRTYEYVFRAQWQQGGETVTRDKTVRFKAGDDRPVDFTQTAAR